MPSIFDRAKNAWDAFKGRDPTDDRKIYTGGIYGTRPDRHVLRMGNAKSIVSPIINKIAVDVAQYDIKHVRLDKEEKYKETIKDSLNTVLTKSANVDQTGRELIRDAVISMCDEGCIAIVPTVIYTPDGVKLSNTDSFSIGEVRVGKITAWYPKHVRVECYNEDKGIREEIVMEKRLCAIIENPFYDTMNAPNSIIQRLVRVLNQLDQTNDQNSAGKIDLLVQLPYAVKSKTRRDEAEERRKALEAQLTGSQYGIGYIDASERVIQLNRSVENNLWSQAKDLQTQLYNQLGLSEKIFDGTADEATMINYQNRTLEPILATIIDEMERKWISKTATAQGQAIRFFKNPFKLTTVSQIAEISDKFTRNEIMSSNEIRANLGMAPSKDPKADELRNSNLNHPDEKLQVDKALNDDSENSKSEQNSGGLNINAALNAVRDLKI